MARALNILVADDELSVVHSVCYVLRLSGHIVESAADGAQALAKITVQPDRFDLLITDNNMPRLSGLQLVQRLRSLNFRGKILVLSAHLGETQAAYHALAVDLLLPQAIRHTRAAEGGRDARRHRGDCATQLESLVTLFLLATRGPNQAMQLTATAVRSTFLDGYNPLPAHHARSQ